jgi:hypothetical protein
LKTQSVSIVHNGNHWKFQSMDIFANHWANIR